LIDHKLGGTDEKKIEDKDYLVLEQTFEDGFTSTLYLDPETYLPFKFVSKTLNNMMMEVDQETFAAEYKKVQGLMLAHSLTIFQDGEKVMMATVNEVKINTGLEDSLFKK
jgi:outer membrane lipoprotein-sorting protein